MRTSRHTRLIPTTLACLTLLLGACATTPPTAEVDYKSDYDFSSIKTLRFDEVTTSGNSSKAQVSDMQIDRMNRALGDVLEAKGFTIVADDAPADATVHWHLVANEKTDIRTYDNPPVRGAYTRYNRVAAYNCWNCGTTSVDVRQFTEGTLIVDILDPDLKRSVWRSVTSSRLKGQNRSNPEGYARAAQIVIGAFPPGATTADP